MFPRPSHACTVLIPFDKGDSDGNWRCHEFYAGTLTHQPIDPQVARQPFCFLLVRVVARQDLIGWRGLTAFSDGFVLLCVTVGIS
jgi:hypothetical protein